MLAIEDLKPGDHLCHFYETEQEHRALITSFLRQGLEQGEKVIVIVDERTPEAILDYLRADRMDPHPYLERGQLVVLSSDETYLRGGTFDPDRMIALLREETDRALAEGYTALRITGEMTWALRGLPGSERLVEYETKLQKFFPKERCLAICQYNKRRFPPDLLLDMLQVHPIVALGTEVYNNLYYRTGHSATAELERQVENLRRGERSRDRAARYAIRLEAIHALGQSLVLTYDRQQICQAVVEAAQQTLGIEVCGLWLLEAERRRLVRAAHAFADRPVALTELPLDAERGILSAVARSGRSIYLPDVREDPRYLAVDARTRSELCVPLVVRGKVLGVLNAESRELDGFDEEDRRLFAILADYAALALANAGMFEAMEAHARELEALNDLGRALSSRLRVEDVAEEVYRQTSRLLDTTNFYIALYDDERDEVTFILDVVEGEASKPLAVRRKGQGLTEYVIRTREPLLIPENVPQRLKELGVEPIGRMPQSWLGVPLIFQDRVIGVIGVQSYTTPRAYGEHERDLLTAIAAQVAVAIENARLYEELRAYAEELEQRVEERTAELRAERERIQAILDGIGEGVIVTDLQGRVEYMNPAAEEITGYTTEEMRGRRCTLWLAEEADREQFAAMAAPLRAGEKWVVEGVLRRKDGTPYDAQLVVNPIRGPDGRPAAYVGILEDVTHLKELNRLKSEFIADAAHELRTPVTTIRLYVDLLRRKPLPEKQAEYLRMLAREADLLAELVEDLLDLSRLERGVAPFDPEPLDLNEVVGEVVTLHARRAAAEGVDLSFEPQTDLPTVTADPGQIQRAVSNLVVNAVNYTPAGGRVVVRTRREAERVEVIVSDTGYGIPDEERERIFDRFFRGSAARKSGAVGSGLGLPIVREIADLHGGGIDVESQVGEGSTFTLWLPV